MRIELTTPATGRVVKELVIQGEVKLSDIVNLMLSELRVNLKYTDLESYYLVVINGNQLSEGTRWSDVSLTNEDYVVIIPLAFGG
ncbi:MAG: hypothetical protein QW267_04750 [Sulfolobales archaeon]